MAKLQIPFSQEDHFLGSDSPLITIVEYGDYECPYCRRAHPIAKSLYQQFSSQLRFVFRHFPITAGHPHAEMAAEATEFAGAHALFWQMHDKIYEREEELSIAFLLKAGESLGLPVQDLENSIYQRSYAAKIRNQFMGGVRSGVNGTPTFFINEERFDGSFMDLPEVIQSLLVHK